MMYIIILIETSFKMQNSVFVAGHWEDEFMKKRTDMELFQGDNTPSPKQTNQEHKSRGRHKVFNKEENPHHAASPK